VAYYEKVSWPADGVLMIMPFDPALHEADSVSARAGCTWGDHREQARWSVVYDDGRIAICDAHLSAYATAELTGRHTARATSTARPAASPDRVVPLAERFERHVLAEVGRLQNRYNPTEFRAMVQRHGAVQATKRLLAQKHHTSYGFERLWELGELGASVEFAVCLPWFAELFGPEEIAEAERRLILHEFPLAERVAQAARTPPSWFHSG